MNNYQDHVLAAAEELTHAYTAMEVVDWRLRSHDALTVAHARSLLWASLATGLKLTTGLSPHVANEERGDARDPVTLLMAAVDEVQPSADLLDLAAANHNQTTSGTPGPFAEHLAAAGTHLAIAVDILSSHLGPHSEPRSSDGAELLRRGGAPHAAADLCSLIEITHRVDQQLHGRLQRAARTRQDDDPTVRRLIQLVGNDAARSDRRPMLTLAESAGEELRSRSGYELRDVTVAVPPNQLLPVDSPAACVAALGRIDFQLAKRPTGITIRQASAVIKAMLTLAEAGQRLHLHAAEHADDPAPHHTAAERWRQAWIAWRNAYTPLLDIRTTHPERGPVTGQALLVSEWVVTQIRPPTQLPMIARVTADRTGRQWVAALPAVAEHSQRIAEHLARSIAATRCLGLLLAPNKHIERGPHAGRLWAPLAPGDRLDRLMAELRVAGTLAPAEGCAPRPTPLSARPIAEVPVRAVTNADSRRVLPEKNKGGCVPKIHLRSSAD